MRAVTLTCVLLLAGCLATAQTYPNCDWKCTSNDVVVTEIVMSGPDLCSLGDPVSGQLLLTLYNRTGTDRYAVRVLADLYVDGLYETSFDDCVAESVPPGTTTLVLAVVDWTCGESLEFRDLIVSWTTKEESCGDTPNCTDRKTKCSVAPVVPVAGTPLAAGFSFDEPICDGDLVAFADATSGGEPPYVYSWDFGDSVGTDTSDDPSYLYDAPGVYTVTLVVTDAAGLNGSATSEVVVSAAPDAEASNGGPYCAGDTIELFAGGGVGYRWSGPDGFTSDDEDPTIASASAAHAGTYTVTVTSASGCSAEASTRVELDTAAPLLTVPSDAEVECGGSTDPARTGEAAATDDRDLSPTVTFSDVATLGACGGFSGTIERTWTATDACGNSVSAVQTITVVDTTDPVLSVPADVTVECDADSSSASTGVATATDNCDPAPAVTESDSVAAGTCLQESVITRTWTATDACGNVASEIQTITIVDTTPPSLSVSGAQFECDGAGNVGNISTWLASAVGADGCSDVTVTENYAGLIGSCPGTGAAEVTFVAIDACGNNAERTATVTVIDTTAPSAEDDAASTDEDAAVTIDVLANDSDACSDSVAFESVGAPTFGTAEIEGREIRYVPPIDFHGTVSFSYTVVDCSGNPDTATVEITVLSVNDPPEANDQAATAREDTPLGMTVTATDPDGDPITYRIVSGPSHGTITGFDADSGELIYTPADDYHGADAFTFEACDPSGACDTATVTITVEAVDDPPSADPQRLTTPEDTPVGITVTGSDADGDPITYRIVSGPSHGTIVGFDAETGGLTYEPERNYTGTDGFVFEACDPDPGHGCAQATVTIVVEPENDPPVASDQTRVTPEDTATGYFSLSIGDPDDGLAELACDCLTPPQHGTVERGANHTVNYTPDADYFGEDRFTYIVCDPDGACDTATVTVRVTNENDNPTVTSEDRTTPEGTPVDVPVWHTDPDGDDLSCTASDPTHGSVEPSSGTVAGPYPVTGLIRYTSDAGYVGIDQFTITCDDGNGGTDTATVEITVLSVNDPPEANDQAATAREDTPLGMTVTATDPDGDPITYRIVSGPSHGTITGFDADSGELIYTPADDYHGADAFTFEACDPSGACDTATVTITVEAVDDPPSADPQRLTTPEDTPVGITVTGSDADGDPITYRIVSGPSHGTIVGFDAETGGLTYEPERNYTGTDGFVFEACDPDPGHGCAQATVTIVVEPENDPPVASDQTRVTPEDTATGYFSLSIGDPDDGLAELACDCLTPPQHGTVERGANHTVNYTPDADYFGEDGFTYIVCDPDGACDTATVLVTVLPANDPPDIGVSGYVTPEDTPVGVGATATDPDGDTLTFTILSSPNHGEIVDFDPARGTGIYVPGAGYSGSDSLFVSVCDSEGGCDVGTITILVVPENDAPTAVCFDTTVTQGVAVDLTLRATDPEGDPISFEIVVPPRHGRIAGFEPLTGALVVVPDTDYVGPDEIVFRACDDSLACDTCVVQLLVVRVSGAGGAAGPCEERIAISEVGWPGTRAGETHEWIELRNLEPAAVNLTGWTLRWRSALSAEGRGGVWRSIRLAGVIGAAEPDAPLVFLRNGAQSQTWWVSWASVPRDDFFLLERGSDDILPLVPADLVYGEETVGLATLDLEDAGAVLELIDPSGCRVDTANVFAPVLGGWAAGSVAPPASMERIDPYGPDVTGNWHTNLGLVRNGLDGMGNLIHGTPRGSNSPILADLVERERLEPATIRSGDPLSIRIETRPEWPLERGLWHVAVLDGRSSEPLAADWAIEGGTEGEAVVRVAIGRWAEGIVHVWIRTPAGALLVALFDVVP